MILLDTSVLIELLRSKDKTLTLFHTLATGDEKLTISSITVYEFRNGMTPTNQQFCEQLLSSVESISFDKQAAIRASIVYQTLRSQSMLINIADILIAATVIEHSCPLATLNLRHFQRVPDLQLF
jgi:tRNA(fMet)-specific endonuclease VapC